MFSLLTFFSFDIEQSAMIPHSHLGWNQQPWIPIAGPVGQMGHMGQMGYQGMAHNLAPFFAHQSLNQNPQNPGLNPMWNANQWQQWNFQAK